MESKTLEQLDKTGADAIKTAQEYGSQIVEFVREQAPELIEEIILFKRVGYSTYVLMGIICGCVAYKLIKMIPSATKKYEDNDENISDFFIMFGSIIAPIGFTIVGIGTICTNLTPCLQVWFAPRLYLLEYFSDLVDRGG